jgi:hypothetical protein
MGEGESNCGRGQMNTGGGMAVVCDFFSYNYSSETHFYFTIFFPVIGQYSIRALLILAAGILNF